MTPKLYPKRLDLAIPTQASEQLIVERRGRGESGSPSRRERTGQRLSGEAMSAAWQTLGKSSGWVDGARGRAFGGHLHALVASLMSTRADTKYTSSCVDPPPFVLSSSSPGVTPGFSAP